jgi:outer membrane immunogenic protein
MRFLCRSDWTRRIRRLVNPKESESPFSGICVAGLLWAASIRGRLSSPSAPASEQVVVNESFAAIAGMNNAAWNPECCALVTDFFVKFCILIRDTFCDSQNVGVFSMKKFLLGTVALAALGMAAPASAADLAARPYTKAAPPMMAPYYDWSGFYVGANGGWGSSHKCWDAGTFYTNSIGDEGCHDATGAVAGGQIGYRWQSSAWVFGLEAQGDWADLRGSQVNKAIYLVAPGDVTNRSKVDAFGLFTGQVGYAWNNVLFYVKGGAAVTRDVYESITTVGAIVGARGSETRWGGAAGAGLEFGFAPNWSVGVEYDHLFMGNRTVGLYSTGYVPLPGPVGTLVGTNRMGQDVDLVTARVNYRWGGPVVAKY